MLQSVIQADLAAADPNNSSKINASCVDNLEQNNSDCALIGQWQFGLSVGLGIRTNPLYDGDNIPLILLPSVNYYGERFFINNLDIGFTLSESDQFSMNLLTTPSYDRVYFSRWDLNNIFVDISSGSVTNSIPAFIGDLNSETAGYAEISAYQLKSRKTSWMAGLEWHYQPGDNHFQFSVLRELGNNHKGHEIRFAWSPPKINQFWSSTLGLTWKDAKMTNYYYGLTEDEVSSTQITYQAKSSIVPFFRINWKLADGEQSFWHAKLEYQQFDQSITKSPIVESSGGMTFFIGKHFNF